MLVDDNEKAGDGSFKLRVIDAWQSTQSLNVYVVANGKNYQNSAPAAKSAAGDVGRINLKEYQAGFAALAGPQPRFPCLARGFLAGGRSHHRRCLR